MDKTRGLIKYRMETNLIVIESLKESLLKLIAEKPYDKITIMELCQKAGVSRMGFYGNFKTKHDIIKKIVLDINMELVDKLGSPFRNSTDSNWYYKVMQFVKEKSPELLLLFDAGFFYEYLDMMNEIVLRDKDLPSDLSYQRIVWSGGIINAITYWLTTGMKESVEDMTNYLSDNLKCWSFD